LVAESEIYRSERAAQRLKQLRRKKEALHCMVMEKTCEAFK
jgi:hypothetical protein